MWYSIRNRARIEVRYGIVIFTTVIGENMIEVIIVSAVIAIIVFSYTYKAVDNCLKDFLEPKPLKLRNLSDMCLYTPQFGEFLYKGLKIKLRPLDGIKGRNMNEMTAKVGSTTYGMCYYSKLEKEDFNELKLFNVDSNTLYLVDTYMHCMLDRFVEKLETKSGD